MPTREKGTDIGANSNTNSNININNITNNVHYPKPKSSRSKPKPRKAKPTPNWYKRAIISGVIALIVSILGYYIKQNLDNKSKGTPLIQSKTSPIEGKREN